MYCVLLKFKMLKDVVDRHFKITPYYKFKQLLNFKIDRN